MKLPPELVIFDCDGVVVDSESVTNDVICANLARHGLDRDPDDLRAMFIGGTMKGVMDRAREMGARLPDNWLDQIYPETFEALAQSVEPVPGITGVLDALDAAGIPYAIGSNGPHAKMEVTLTRTGLKDRFGGVAFSREDVPNPKPAPDVYLLAARNAGVVPEKAVVIEDSASGAKAGVAAGMRTYGFIRETPKDVLAPICDALFESMEELPLLLGLR